jgi:hypothetical protein
MCHLLLYGNNVKSVQIMVEIQFDVMLACSAMKVRRHDMFHTIHLLFVPQILLYSSEIIMSCLLLNQLFELVL